MTERIRGATAYQQQQSKMPDVGPKKTLFVLIIVVGCFAVLWPKVFYPMLVGTAQQRMKPSDIDRTTGCCDVISDADVNTIKIMSELCSSIIEREGEGFLSGKEIISRCRAEVLKACGIDISAVLQEQVRLGTTVKQILDEVRSLNGSLCLKYSFGLSPWKLGVPHRITIRAETVKQERPPHLKSELIHPAFRERGRAIPSVPRGTPKTNPPPRVVEGRPGPVPGMRPPMGGAGHVVPPSTKGTNSMSVIMPVYTVGIVIFFTYTLMKLLFKKQPDSVGGSLYPPVEPDGEFRREVFESEKSQLASRYARDGISSKLVVSAMSALLDEVDHELESRKKAFEVAEQDECTLANGAVSHEQTTPSVKVLGMETMASCEGGQKWNRPDSPVTPVVPPAHVTEEPPQEIYLEGALPAQSKLLVADSATETQPNEAASDPAVVLAGKMTLSVISPNDEDEDKKAEVNGQDAVDESIYTTVSNATAAEKDILEEENTDDEGIEAVEEIQYDEEVENSKNDVPELNGKESEVVCFSSSDEAKETESAVEEFIQKELNSALEESYTQEDAEELIYDQIRKEEEAELREFLSKGKTEHNLPHNIFEAEQKVLQIATKPEEQGTVAVLEEMYTHKNDPVKDDEFLNILDSPIKTRDNLELAEEAIFELQNSSSDFMDKTVKEDTSELKISQQEEENNTQAVKDFNSETAKEDILVSLEEETAKIVDKTLIQEDILEVTAPLQKEEENILEKDEVNQAVIEEPAANLKKIHEVKAVADEQIADVSCKFPEQVATSEGENNIISGSSQGVELNEASEVSVSQEKTEKETVDLNDFDSNDYEIEEYEVEVDEDAEDSNEIIVLDEDEPLSDHEKMKNLPKE